MGNMGNLLTDELYIRIVSRWSPKIARIVSVACQSSGLPIVWLANSM